jgi:hypothetical protein
MVSKAIAKTHAFSYKVWGYDARIDNRVENQVIRLNSVIASDRYQAVQEAHNAATNGTHGVSTEEELDFDMGDKSLLTGVVVGMRPSCSPVRALGYGNAELLRICQKKASVRTLKRDRILKHDPAALWVVCLRFGKDAVFYALTKRDEDTSLCDAVLISAEQVFFFPEFRNDTEKDTHTRKKTWGEKIRAMMMGRIASEGEVDDKIPVLLERNLSTSLASF